MDAAAILRRMLPLHRAVQEHRSCKARSHAESSVFLNLNRSPGTSAAAMRALHLDAF